MSTMNPSGGDGGEDRNPKKRVLMNGNDDSGSPPRKKRRVDDSDNSPAPPIARIVPPIPLVTISNVRLPIISHRGIVGNEFSTMSNNPLENISEASRQLYYGIETQLDVINLQLHAAAQKVSDTHQLGYDAHIQSLRDTQQDVTDPAVVFAGMQVSATSQDTIDFLTYMIYQMRTTIEVQDIINTARDKINVYLIHTTILDQTPLYANMRNVTAALDTYIETLKVGTLISTSRTTITNSCHLPINFFKRDI